MGVSQDLVPKWSVSAWVYDPNLINMMSNYNCFNMIYPYGTDLMMSGLDGSLPNFNGLSSTFKYVSPIIDGRIDNGDLKGLNTASASVISNLAKDLINAAKSETTSIQGLQLDFEPFDNTMSNQIDLYTQIGQGLAQIGKFYSIFIFPNQMTQATATMLNAGNNGYVTISLYDLVDGLPSNCTNQADPNQCVISNAPLPLSLNGVPSTAVPHSPCGYLAAATAAVEQTIYMSTQDKNNKIKYKFAIPGGPSVHEFVQWGNYNNKSMGSPLPTYAGGATSQRQYVEFAFTAIKTGIANQKLAGNYDPTLFRGIDVYAFNTTSTWSPDSDKHFEIYTATEGPAFPGYPTADVLTYIQANIGDLQALSEN